jgi:hypothetical protein
MPLMYNAARKLNLKSFDKQQQSAVESSGKMQISFWRFMIQPGLFGHETISKLFFTCAFALGLGDYQV